MNDLNNIKVGCFYWVLIVLDPDSEFINEDCSDLGWENKIMPARYAGNGKWFYLNMEGPSDWPVRWIGEEIRAKL